MEHSRIQYYSISEAARICGVTAKQIRNWEEKGYIPSPARFSCGERQHRQYNEEDLRIISRVRAYLDAGYTLTTAADKAATDSDK